MSSPRELAYDRARADLLVLGRRGDRVAFHHAAAREALAELDLVRDLLGDPGTVDVGGELRHRRRVSDIVAGYRHGIRNRRGW